MTVQALHFYKDEDSNMPISDSVDMGAVTAGETVEKTFYVKNQVDYVVDVEGFILKSVSGDSELVDTPEKVEPGDTEPVVIKLSPDTAEVSSLKFELKASYKFKTE